MDEMNRTSMPEDDESYRLIEDVYNEPEYGSDQYFSSTIAEQIEEQDNG